MKKTLKITLIIAILLTAIFALAGCGAKSEDQKKSNVNPIVGSWKSEYGDYVYQFNEDGTGSYNVYSTKMEFTYKTEGKNISITYNGNTIPFETEYSIDGDTLNVIDSFGNDTLYKKQ